LFTHPAHLNILDFNALTILGEIMVLELLKIQSEFKHHLSDNHMTGLLLQASYSFIFNSFPVTENKFDNQLCINQHSPNFSASLLKMRNAYKILNKKSEGKRLLGRPRHTHIWDGSILLEWILGKLGGKVWPECTWLRVETSGKLL
jgi:hypothetical protein